MTVYPNSADKWNNSDTEYCFYKVFSVNYENEEVPWFYRCHPEPHAAAANLDSGFHPTSKLQQTGHNTYQMQLNCDVG